MSSKVRNWIGHGLVLLIFLGAASLLYQELKHYKVRDIVDSIQAIPIQRLFLALGLMLLNYCVLFCYDFLAIRSIGRSLPFWKLAMAAFIGHSCSFNFGAILGGSAVRYRLYSIWGLSAVDIVKLLLVLGVTFWVGALALAGVMFLWQPLDIPPKLNIPFENVRYVGSILLVVVIAYLGMSFFSKRPLTFRGHKIQPPSLPMAIAQLLVASADFTVAAGILYVLLPDSANISFSHFLSIYLLAIVGGVVTHVPGGLAILELVVVTLVSTAAQPQVVEKDALIASLVAFRVIYYFIPLFPALSLLAAADVMQRDETGKANAKVASPSSSTAPPPKPIDEKVESKVEDG